MARAASEEVPGGDGSLARARQLLAGPAQDALRRVISRSIAIGSGKGGVGKTITACNLASFYARKGLRVGLVDLDPLSDVASLLDLPEPSDGGTPASPDPLLVVLAIVAGCVGAAITVGVRRRRAAIPDPAVARRLADLRDRPPMPQRAGGRPHLDASLETGLSSRPSSAGQAQSA